MSGKNAEREQRRQDAQERAFEALLEQELGAGAPVAAILARARATDGRERSPGRTRRSLLVAAVVLLGAGVVAFAAWQGRVGRGGDEAEQQGLTEPVDLLWPDGSPRAYRPSDLDSLRADLTHLRLSAPLHEIGALSRFAELQQLYVALTPSKVWRPVMSGEAARARDRLGVLSTTPELRRLSLGGVAVEPEDLRSLRHLRHLQVLELNSLMPTVADDEMREAAKLGGFLAGRSFDLALAEEVAASARCGTLRLSGMEVTAAALQALAPMGLRALAVETPTGTGPAALRALGQLTTLERLELRCVHVTDVPGEAAQLGGIGAAALAPDVMRAIAALPKLRSLVLEACVLDHELLAALPTGLSELDLRGCLGVDGRLADIVARMPNLRSLGVPLAMQQGRDFGSMLRPPLEGDVARTMRLSDEAAASLLASRVWSALQLEGALGASVAAAVGGQMELRELVLTPTSGSVGLSFLTQLPKLERLRFVAASFADQAVLSPLRDVASLHEVEFVDCSANRRSQPFTLDLRDDQVARWFQRRAW